MKKMFLALSFLPLGWHAAFAQITIEECYRRAQANYPLIEQYDLIEKTAEYNLSNANKGYLPQVMFSAKASYQSDVVRLPIDLSQLGIQGVSIPTVNKDQYGETLDIRQTIWDGGTIKSQKESIRTASEVDKANVDVSIYAVNERINQLYFGILLTDAQIRQNRLLQDELERQYSQVRSYMENGIANQTDLDAIKVDQLKARQSEAQFANTRQAYIDMLSIMIGERLSADTEFTKPEPIVPSVRAVYRPELSLFDAQIRKLEAKNREITSGLMPKLSLTVTGGYGNPGLNMLTSGFEAYYMAGVRLSWNIGNFYTKKNKRREIQTSIRNIETQRETFLFNTDLDITQKESSIDTYFDQLRYDDEIIELRVAVKQASEAKMANGTLSGSDLIRDINAEQMARQDKIMREMELLLAIYNLKFATNN